MQMKLISVAALLILSGCKQEPPMVAFYKCSDDFIGKVIVYADGTTGVWHQLPALSGRRLTHIEQDGSILIFISVDGKKYSWDGNTLSRYFSKKRNRK